MANANELETHLIDEWARFDQLIMDAALGQWRRRLGAYVRGAGHTLSTKYTVLAILSSIYQNFLN